MEYQITRITPRFYTKELEATKDYYESILNFTCESWQPDWGWSLYRFDEAQIMYTLPNDHIPFDGPCFTGSVYLYVDSNIESLWQRLKSQVKVAYPLEEFDYGMKEFAFYDLNGYMLQFGEEYHLS